MTIHPASSFPDLKLARVTVAVGRHLPRWEANGAIYHVSFHLADSVPREQLVLWHAERARLSELVEKEHRQLTDDERQSLREVYDERIERYLAAGHGESLLRDARVAEAVLATLEHDNGKLYALHEVAVMPNHVHVVVGNFAEGCTLKNVVDVWKRISGHSVNRLLGRQGRVWHRDAYTHIVRTAEEYARQLGYVWHNPDSAGLKDGFLRKRYVT